MPADEWIGDARDVTTETMRDRHVFFDSVSSPRASVTAEGKYTFNGAGASPAPWRVVGSKLLVPSNISFNIWFLCAQYDSTTGYWLSNPDTTSSIRMYKAEQFMGMRGDR
jgi:hypothetical protein